MRGWLRPFGTLLVSSAFCVAVSAAGAQRALDPGRPASEPILLKADLVTHYEDLGIVAAAGSVELAQGDQVLLADSVTYNQKTDTVTATGNVSVMQPNGDVLFADRMELSDGLREGFVDNLRALLSDNSRFAANAARRVGGERKEMSRAVFSPCRLCEKDPTRPPLWQIKAVKVVHDEARKDIDYRDATLEMWGLPVAYFPAFSHPDPTVKQRSGFLSPRIGQSGEVGTILGIPYYYAIGPDKDLTVEPTLFSKDGLQLLGEYRQRHRSGQADLKGSIGYLERREGGRRTDDRSAQGHIDSSLKFDLSDDFRSGLHVQRATDRLYFKRYKIGDPQTLVTRGYVEGFAGRNYAILDSYAFQGLRSTDIRDQTPLALPFARYSFVGEPGVAGGRYLFDATALSLTRNVGADSHRLGFTGGWDLPHTSRFGEIYTLSTRVYADGYYTEDVADPDRPSSPRDGFTGRAVPQIAISWRYPWVKREGAVRQSLEPIAAFVASPVGGNPMRIPNEDSQTFELDETNLFALNRFAGIDRISTGQRIDYGLRYGIYGDRGGRTTFLVGQSFQFQRDPSFVIGSGAENEQTDYVGRLTVSPNRFLDLIYRFRLDREDFSFRRNEIGFGAGPDRFRLDANYLLIDRRSDTPTLGLREEISGSVTARIAESWTLQFRAIRDLGAGSDQNRLAALRLGYEDECFAFVIDAARRFTSDGALRPETAIFFRLVFKHLGQVEGRGLSF
jgi:LPS-assembly protein